MEHHAKSPHNKEIPNTIHPTAGQGLTLTDKARVPTKALVEPWHEVGATNEPAFENSWVNFAASTHATAAFCKDSAGWVHIKGLVKSGTISAALPVFTLPEGYRPPLLVHIATVSNSLFGMLAIAADGGVFAAVGSNVWISIHISFRSI